MITYGGIWPVREDGTIPFTDSLIISLVAILIVFAILALLIIVAELINKGTKKVSDMTAINAREENKILDEDPDAAVAVLVATIDFNKETGKDANVVSVTKLED